MGTIQVPGRRSGRTYTVNIKGDTPTASEQERIRGIVQEREDRFLQKYESQFGEPAPEPDDGTALGRGYEAGKAGAYSRLGSATEYLGKGLGIDAITGLGRDMRASGDYESFLESMRQPAPTTLEDVKNAEGIFPTIGKALTYAGEGVGQSVPEMAAPLVASIAGMIGGTAATGNPITGAGIGLGAGAVTAFHLSSVATSNVKRKKSRLDALPKSMRVVRRSARWGSLRSTLSQTNCCLRASSNPARSG